MKKIRLATTAILTLLALTALTGCLGETDLKTGFNMTPTQLGDGWEISTPAAQGFDEGKLRQAYRLFFDEDEYHTAYSLLVIRHGRLVAEGYCRDLGDRDRLNNIKSATKSVTSLIAGIAISEGMIGSLDDTVHSYLASYFPPGASDQKKSITVEDLLTMRSGIKFDNSVNNTEMLAELLPSSSLRYILEQPMEYPPGTRGHYHDGAPHLLSGIIQERTGKTLEEYGREKLLAPLGINDYFWEAYEEDGVTFGAFGLYLTPRSLGKIGQLALNRGSWRGRQIVPAQWVDRSTTTHAYMGPGAYGYYWWIRPGFDAYTANGHGGQYAYVIPHLDMVIVFTANPQTNEPASAIGVSYFEDLVFRITEAVVR